MLFVLRQERSSFVQRKTHLGLVNRHKYDRPEVVKEEAMDILTHFSVKNVKYEGGHTK